MAGTAGRSHQPVAITTFAARQPPSSVEHRRSRRRRRRTARTGLCSHAPGAATRGVASRWAANAGAVMNRRGREPRYGRAGSRLIQLGVSRRSESQRSLRHRSRDPAALEHDVVAAAVGQAAATRRARPGRRR